MEDRIGPDLPAQDNFSIDLDSVWPAAPEDSATSPSAPDASAPVEPGAVSGPTTTTNNNTTNNSEDDDVNRRQTNATLGASPSMRASDTQTFEPVNQTTHSNALPSAGTYRQIEALANESTTDEPALFSLAHQAPPTTAPMPAAPTSTLGEQAPTPGIQLAPQPPSQQYLPPTAPVNVDGNTHITHLRATTTPSPSHPPPPPSPEQPFVVGVTNSTPMVLANSMATPIHVHEAPTSAAIETHTGGALTVSHDQHLAVPTSTTHATHTEDLEKNLSEAADTFSMNTTAHTVTHHGADTRPQRPASRASHASHQSIAVGTAHPSGGLVHVAIDDEEREPGAGFEFSTGLSTAQADERLLKYGRNELVEKSTPSWLIFLRGLYGPMPIAIWIAVVVEYALQSWIDGSILLFILFANATISWYESIKAGNAVAALKKSLKPIATVFRDGEWKNIDGAVLVPGDLVMLGSGSAVPADCVLHEAEIDIDESALTGESLPVAMHRGMRPKMGSNVVRGEGHATVEHTGMQTFFGRTASLIQAVGPRLEGIQRLLVRVMVVLTSISFILCLAAFLYLLLHTREPVEDALEFTVVLLVASIPIAIEIVVTTTLATGSRELTKFQAIVTRLAAIEQLAGMNMLCSDKTGTLTLNEMQIQNDCPCYVAGHNKDTVLVLAALAAKWREPPRDALDRMVLGAANLTECDRYKQLEYKPFDPAIKRTEATIESPDGFVFKVTKGAPHVVLRLCNNQDMIAGAVHDLIERLGATGTRCLAVAQTDGQGLWEMVGVLTFLDPPRPDTKSTTEKAWANGVNVKMITGDHAIIAKEMARRLGLGTNIQSADTLPVFSSHEPAPKDLGDKFGARVMAADGFAGVFPEHKFMIVEILRQYGFTCGMTGDGVNDAPALKRADVGIAVAGATDAARAAADIVLTSPGLHVIIEAIVIARVVFNRIKSFMIYRIAATLQLLLFFFISVFAFPPVDYEPSAAVLAAEDSDPWPNFFSIPVLMLMLITLLNDGTLLTIGYDRVLPSRRPQKWNLPAMFLVSTVLAVVACASSLLLLWGALDSHNPNGWFAAWGLPPLEYGKVVTLMYLKVSVSDFMTLFSSRAVDGYFFQSRPATILLAGSLIALTISSVLASEWPDGSTSGIPTVGLAHGDYTLYPLWVWIYCIGWWFAQDLAKVATYRLLTRFDIFQYRTLGSQLHFENQFASNDPNVRHHHMSVPDTHLDEHLERHEAALASAGVTPQQSEASMQTKNKVDQTVVVMSEHAKNRAPQQQGPPAAAAAGAVGASVGGSASPGPFKYPESLTGRAAATTSPQPVTVTVTSPTPTPPPIIVLHAFPPPLNVRGSEATGGVNNTSQVMSGSGGGSTSAPYSAPRSPLTFSPLKAASSNGTTSTTTTDPASTMNSGQVVSDEKKPYGTMLWDAQHHRAALESSV